jgi:ribokinase
MSLLWVVGSINLDVTARVGHLPQWGETLLAADGYVSPGGKGANQALAARRMGVDVSLVGAVGRDALATAALALLRQDGVNLDHVQVVDSLTGTAVIAVDDGGQNAITVIAGANRAVTPQRFRPGPGIGRRDWLLVSLEVPMEAVRAAVQWAQAHRAGVLVDPAPAPDDLPRELWNATVLMPNRGEAEHLLDMPIRDLRDAKAAARALRDRGADIGIVKLGADGLVWASRHGVFYLPPTPVTAVDTTGAGDCFAGVLAAGLAQGLNLGDAIGRAARAAAIACTRPGAQTAFPRAADVEGPLAEPAALAESDDVHGGH